MPHQITSNFPAASLILSTLASDSPFTLHRARRVVIWIPFTVQIPTDFSFLMSAMFFTDRYTNTTQVYHYIITSMNYTSHFTYNAVLL